MNTAPRNVILLGASSDIGSVLAKRVDDAGDRLLRVSRSSSEASPIGASGAVQTVEGVDLLTVEGQARLVDAVNSFIPSAESDEYDLAMIHCVGDFWHHRELDRLEPRMATDTMLTHYATLAESVVSLLPVLMGARASRIIAFSCNSVAYAYPHMAPFTAAKAAIETFMRCVAHEYSKQRIATTTIALPTVLTPKVQKAKPQGDHANYITPEHVASVVLREMGSSPFVTGNLVRMIKHSETFYGMGYLQRNPPE
jgi:NAD(P)-dependent dehydrogenase (short-subunit alcohol dehydrogenase family)